MQMMKSIVLLLTCLLLLQAEPTTGYMIIVGGGTTQADANKYLQKYQSETEMQHCIEESDFPTTLLSDTIEGLNPGFHIAVAEIFPYEAQALLFLEMIRDDMNGVYMREVTVHQSLVEGAFSTNDIALAQIIRQREKAKAAITNKDQICSTSTELNLLGGYSFGIKVKRENDSEFYTTIWEGEHGDYENSYYLDEGTLKVFQSRSSTAQYGSGMRDFLGMKESGNWCYFIDGQPVAFTNHKSELFILGHIDFDEKLTDVLYQIRELREEAKTVSCD